MFFSVAGALALAGWLTLLISPLILQWSENIAGLVIPISLSLGYVILSVFFLSAGDSGFGTLADVAVLFSQPEALLAGWVHFLAFDLFIGAWICKTARQQRIRFWRVLPCLPLTFLFGPADLLAFYLVRLLNKTQLSPQ